jgi:hypothetical protein
MAKVITPAVIRDCLGRGVIVSQHEGGVADPTAWEATANLEKEGWGKSPGTQEITSLFQIHQSDVNVFRTAGFSDSTILHILHLTERY